MSNESEILEALRLNFEAKNKLHGILILRSFKMLVKISSEISFDLFETRRKRTVWLNLFRNSFAKENKKKYVLHILMA